MRVKVKKGLVVFLALCMLLSMLPVFTASAAGSDLSVATTWKTKTVKITGTVADLAGKSASLFILEPAFNGDPATIPANMNLVKEARQINVPADGKIDLTYTLSTAILEGNYYLFINGAAYSARFSFGEASDIKKYTVTGGEQVTIPIIAEGCVDLIGLKANVVYDSDLLTLDSIDLSDDFYVGAGSGNVFTALAKGALPLSGNLIVGYVTFTANVDLEDDITTYVSFDVDYALSSATGYTTVELNPARVDILAVVVPGDVNGDKVVDLRDAVLLLQLLSHTIEGELTPKQIRAANVAGNEYPSVADVIMIMQMSLN